MSLTVKTDDVTKVERTWIRTGGSGANGLKYLQLSAFVKNCSTNWNNHLKSLGVPPEEGIKTPTYKNIRLIKYLGSYAIFNLCTKMDLRFHIEEIP